ncbi:MerR family transcriptional regulator [Nocardioides panacisoli]|uniref:HTH merR-type domain-containing protein n=1 Tax=Nocardioides panacisoli TaxID=627624 RepID=A0ABP7IU03_9ACTN
MTGLSIAEAAERLGLTVDTLRYYEKDDLLLRAVPRASSGHRRYQEDDLRWIELVTRLRATGMPIRDVRR